MREQALVDSYANEFANGDPRNVPVDYIPKVYEQLTGDAAGAQALAQRAEELRALGYGDRQIADILRSSYNPNPLDYVGQGREGTLGAGEKRPTYDSTTKTGNAMWDQIMDSAEWYTADPDEKGAERVYLGADGKYYRRIPKADGTFREERFNGTPVLRSKYSPEEILSLYVDELAGTEGHSTWNFLPDLMDGLTPEQQAGMQELLAKYAKGGDPNAERSDKWSQEFANMTEDEYEYFAQLFMSKFPELQELVNQGLLKKEDIANFFFKALPEGTGSGTGTGTGSGSYSGKGYYGYGYGGGYGYPVYYGGGKSTPYLQGNTPYAQKTQRDTNSNPVNTNQRQSRIYNIMKNWSF